MKDGSGFTWPYFGKVFTLGTKWGTNTEDGEGDWGASPCRVQASQKGDFVLLIALSGPCVSVWPLIDGAHIGHSIEAGLSGFSTESGPLAAFVIIHISLGGSLKLRISFLIKLDLLIFGDLGGPISCCVQRVVIYYSHLFWCLIVPDPIGGAPSSWLPCPLTRPCHPPIPAPWYSGMSRTLVVHSLPQPWNQPFLLRALFIFRNSCSLEARIWAWGVLIAIGGKCIVCVWDMCKGMYVHMHTHAHLVCTSMSLGLLKSMSEHQYLPILV